MAFISSTYTPYPLFFYSQLYRNDSSCSDLCECRDEGHTMTCRRLPCPAAQNCKEQQMSYGESTVSK